MWCFVLKARTDNTSAKCIDIENSTKYVEAKSSNVREFN